MGWDTDDSTGLLGHYIGTVKKSEWDTNARLKGDGKNTLLFWTTTVDDILQDDFDKVPPPEVVVVIGIGSGWNADEDGYTVEHEEQKEEFKSSTLYGKIINGMTGKSDTYPAHVVLDGGPDLELDMSDLMSYMKAQGYSDPRDARIWENLQFEFRGLGFKYRNQDTEPRMKPVPARFLGVGSDNIPSDSGSARTNKPAEAREVDREAIVAGFESSGASPDLAGTLADLVVTSKSHTAFSRNALMLDEVKGNDALKAVVMDEATGPWSLK